MLFAALSIRLLSAILTAFSMPLELGLIQIRSFTGIRLGVRANVLAVLQRFLAFSTMANTALARALSLYI